MTRAPARHRDARLAGQRLTKAARQARIAELLDRVAVHSQEELADLLAGEAAAVSQGTLSRDLAELGARKLPSARGGAYALDGPAPAGSASPGGDGARRLTRLVAELVVGIEGAGQLVVVRTLPGAAPLLASALDRDRPAGVIGSVGGDDTVLLACRGPGDGPVVAARLQGVARRASGRAAGSG